MESLEQSLAIRDENAYNLFYLSMGYWKLSSNDAAHAFYSRAIKRAAKNSVADAHLEGLRAEAGQLLGISDSETE